MGIAANWGEIKTLMDVYGYIDGQWQRFEKQVNYQAFLVIRKQWGNFVLEVIMENLKSEKVKKVASENPRSVRDYGNDPYFVKKANKSKAFLEKNGFPKELLDKRRVGI